jgi:hypothetical protein
LLAPLPLRVKAVYPTPNVHPKFARNKAI